MENLTEKEKRTLSWLLKGKIKDTFEMEQFYRDSMNELTEEEPKKILKEVLQSIYNERENCYEIARKLGIK